MITGKNYFEESKPYAPLLTGAFTEAHDLATSLKSQGTDPFNTGDPDIGGVMEKLLEEVNKLHDAKKIQNRTAVKKGQNLKPVKKGTAKPVVKNKGKKAIRAAASKRKTTLTAHAHKRRGVKKGAKKQAGSQKIEKAPVTVKKLSFELQTIKTFVGMQDKKYTLPVLVNKHKALSNHIKAGHVADHKNVIEEVAQKLSKAKKIAETAEVVTINIDKAFIAKCNAIINGAKVRVRTEFLSGVNLGIAKFIPSTGDKIVTRPFTEWADILKTVQGNTTNIASKIKRIELASEGPVNFDVKSEKAIDVISDKERLNVYLYDESGKLLAKEIKFSNTKVDPIVKDLIAKHISEVRQVNIVINNLHAGLSGTKKEKRNASLSKAESTFLHARSAGLVHVRQKNASIKKAKRLR